MLQRETVARATKALMKYEAEKSGKAGKQDLFETGSNILVQFTMKEMPDKSQIKPKLIKIPHRIMEEDVEICVITRDEQRTYKDLLSGIDNIKKVISVSKLKKKFSSHETRKNLATSFDVFLCDDKIFHLLPSVLGTHFIRRKKMPLPLNLDRKKEAIAKDVLKVLNSTFLRIGAGGLCFAVKLATTAQSEEDIVDNVIEGMKSVSEALPFKNKEFFSIFLKSDDSVSLPIYQEEKQTSKPDGGEKKEKDEAKSPSKGKLADVEESNDEEPRKRAKRTKIAEEKVKAVGSPKKRRKRKAPE